MGTVELFVIKGLHCTITLGNLVDVGKDRDRRLYREVRSCREGS